METKQPKAKKAKKESKGFRGIESAFLVIVVCFIIAVCIYNFILGDVNNFTDATKAEPKPGNMLGTIYKGGIIVPVLQTLLLTVLVLSIERAFAIMTAKGKGSLTKFVANVKAALAANDLAKAQEYCDKQRGSGSTKVDVSMKKVSRSTVTSLIAVISMAVLFLFTFTFGIILLFQKLLITCCG